MSKKKLTIYFILAFITLALGILLCIPSMAKDILNIVLAIGLAIYVVFFLVRRILKNTNTLKLAVYIVEITLVSLMALGLLLAQFDVFVLTDEIVQTLGLVLWLRGISSLIIGTFGAYNKKEKTILVFAVAVLLTLGTWLFLAPFISNDTLIIVFIVIFFLVFIFATLVIVNYFIKKQNIKTKK